MNPVLHTEGLSKWFSEVVAVNNLNVSLEPGVIGLLGPNGAGKSTFIRLALGLYEPSRGTVKLYGETPRNNLGVLRRVGFCPEGDAFYEGMTGLQFVTWMNRYYGMAPRAARLRAEDVLEHVQMTERMKSPITSYSKGMRQRIKIAQALAMDPDFLVLDEPLQGLDPEGREDMFALIRRIGQSGKSVLMSSHILYEIERVTDTVLLLQYGCVLAHGSVREIRDLIDAHPHAVTVAGNDVRAIADHFVTDEATLSLEFDDGQVVIRTKDPAGFYEQLNALVVTKGVDITLLQCADDNLQSVFDYLVH
jgi:ABC-2 type transport system ATP-binding protein